MTEDIIGRLATLEITQKDTTKIIAQLAKNQEANDRAIDRLLIKFQDHFAVEEQAESKREENRERHEQTLHELNDTVRQLNVQLASMPGLHDRTTRDLLTPLWNRCREVEDENSQLKLNIETTVNKSEEKTKRELISLGKTYAYITSFLVSIILVVCGYLYLDLKQASDLNTQHILENIRQHDRKRG